MILEDRLLLYQLICSLITSEYKVPGSFSRQCKAIKNMLSSDETGLINSILNYAINSASSVQYKIEVYDNNNLENILNDWLYQINKNRDYFVPVGINELAKEYFKERWLGSSFCILKIIWKKDNNGIILPKTMYFLDGSSVEAEEVAGKENTLEAYQYKLNDIIINPVTKEYIIQKPYARWFDGYPIPYLVKNGILRNFYSIKTLKEKADEVIGKILPYLLFLKKGSERLAIEGRQALQDNDLKTLMDNFKTFLSEYKNKIHEVPIYVAPFDTEISHIIPELKNILNIEIYAENIRAILAGLGFIELSNYMTSGTSRRETIINPRPFIEEVNSAIEDFKSIIQTVIYYIIDKNKVLHPKYFSDINKIKITNSPLKLNVNLLLDQLRMAYIYGIVSIETYCEALGLDFEREKERRLQEMENNIDKIFYPHQIQNPPEKIQSKEPITKKEIEKENEKTEGVI